MEKLSSNTIDLTPTENQDFSILQQQDMLPSQSPIAEIYKQKHRKWHELEPQRSDLTT